MRQDGGRPQATGATRNEGASGLSNDEVTDCEPAKEEPIKREDI